MAFNKRITFFQPMTKLTETLQEKRNEGEYSGPDKIYTEISEVYLEPCQTSMMERFATKTKNCSLFFVKYSILDVSQSAEYASECTERTKSRIINTLTTNVPYHI